MKGWQLICVKNSFTKGNIDTTLFTKQNENGDLLIVQIYVDDIIFGSTNMCLCEEFSKIMQKEFEMSMMGELKYFLGLQIKQLHNGIFICQSKYTKELLQRFGMNECKQISTPMCTSTKLGKDEDGQIVDQKNYRANLKEDNF